MSGLIFSVDAGSAQSAFVLFDPALQRIVDLGIDTNESLLKQILLCPPRIAVFAYERIASFGFPVGKEVLDTAEWNGRFRQAAERTNSVRVYGATRKEVVVHHTGKATGGDPQIRAAMIARFGKENLQGCKTHIWSALSVAAYASDHMNLSGGSSDVTRDNSNRHKLAPAQYCVSVSPSGGADLATTDSPSRSEPKNKALTAPPAQSLSSVFVRTDLNPNANDAVRRRIDQRVVIARESTEPKPNCVKGATDSRGGRKPLTSGGDKKGLSPVDQPTDPSRVQQTGVRSRGGVLPARFSGEVSGTSGVKRRRCVACGLMTEHWQRINGGPWHCYDGCRSTTGRDRRVQPQALQPS